MFGPSPHRSRSLRRRTRSVAFCGADSWSPRFAESAYCTPAPGNDLPCAIRRISSRSINAAHRSQGSSFSSSACRSIGLYLAGAVVAGANRGEVFIENGRFHGRVVVEHIAHRLGREPVGA